MAVQPFSIAKRFFGRRPDQGGSQPAGLHGAPESQNGADHSAARRPLRVLAIDGGGIRGILPAMLLSDLERRTNRPIIDLFDLIVGTSTGGLVALALACPTPEGKPRHTARDIVRLYEVEGKRVFSRSVWHKIRSVGALAEGKYPSAGIEGVLQDYFGECRLKDALADVVVPAYEIERRMPFFFKTANAKAKSYYDYPMKNVIRA